MDWQQAITRNRDALLAIVAALMVMVGLRAGGTLTTLPRFLYARALLIVRQAESAMRRLIVIAAHALALRGVTRRKARASSTDFAALPALPTNRSPTFNLIDPLKTFGGDVPDYDGFGAADFCAPPVPASSLALRIAALKHALDTIPHQATRLLRWYAQRDLALARNQPHRLSPMRPGLAPAARRRKKLEVEKVLLECHLLAVYAGDRRDSS